VLILGATTIQRNEVYKDTAVIWKDVVNKHPLNPRGWNNYGEAILGADPRASADAFVRAIELDPEFTLARVNHAAALIDLKEYDAAIVIVNAVLETEPDRPDANIKLGLIRFYEGDLDAAIAAHERALEIEPRREDAQINLEQFVGLRTDRDEAKRLSDRGHQRAAAEKYLAYIEKMPNDVVALVDYAELAVNAGVRSGVVDLLNHVLTLDAGNTHATFLLMSAQALQDGENVITDDLDAPIEGEDNPQASQRWYRLGLEYRDADDFESAEQAYRTAIEYDLTNISARYSLGRLLQNQGYYDEAILEYLDVIDLSPRRVDAQSNLGLCYFKLGDTRRAEEAFRGAIEKDAEHFQSQMNLAVVLDTTGRSKEAIVAYERVLELVPGHRGATKRLIAIRARLIEQGEN